MAEPRKNRPRKKPRKHRARYIGWGALSLLAVAVTWVALDPGPVRRFLVRAKTPKYVVAEPGDLKPTFTGPVDRRREIGLALVAEGLTQPTDLQFPPGSDDLAVVLEKPGTMRFVRLDNGVHGELLRVDVLTVSEQGLLGLAFHPDFASNGRFFLNCVQEGSDGAVSRVLEYRASRPEALRDSPIERVGTILEVAQPYQNHNAGQLAFGPDGYLYVGWGDGGYRDDPKGNGQNPRTLLGSMLRLDVDRRQGERRYAIPKDNPFVERAGFAPETYAFGLRNPWRHSFDPDGRLIVADVGQNTWEEIDIVQGGDNLGWNLREGFECFVEQEEACERDDLVPPVHVYGRELGVSITGGYVYLGSDLPQLAGLYVFGDFASGRIFALKLPRDRTHRVAQALSLGKWPLLISTFGRDHRGELYLADYGAGAIYRFTPPGERK